MSRASVRAVKRAHIARALRRPTTRPCVLPYVPPIRLYGGFRGRFPGRVALVHFGPRSVPASATWIVYDEAADVAPDVWAEVQAAAPRKGVTRWSADGKA